MSDRPALHDALSNLILQRDSGIARLEPFAQAHARDLLAAGSDESVWRWLPHAGPDTLDDARRIIDEALAARERGLRYPFAIIHRPTGAAVGSTSFLDVRPADRNIEIGWTWIARDHQRTALNTECKLLLLTCAFESLGMLRVCLKTDARNIPSRSAIERLGAAYEGTLRSHLRTQGDHIRSSAYYSVLESEWPDVKRRLESMLARR